MISTGLMKRLGLMCFRLTKRKISIFESVENGSLQSVPIENIRNFSVIAHVDHGKSTLSDCILQLTGNIAEKERRRGQVMDTLKVERDRGITVKAQTASMIFQDTRPGKEQSYLLNLIDTPGHIDFAYEVSRSLASCQGALLLVDSTQSVQAQTLANFNKAKALGLSIIPVVTKIDLPNAQPEEAAKVMSSTFHLDVNTVLKTSAKQNIGIREVLEAIVDYLPPPNILPSQISTSSHFAPFIGRIVDSWFDEHRGVVTFVQGMSGCLHENQRFTTYNSSRENSNNGSSSNSGGKDNSSSSTSSSSLFTLADFKHVKDFSVQEIGLLTPTTLRTKKLQAGNVGYVVSGMKSTRQARIGDTVFVPAEWINKESELQPLEGYAAAKQTLFASVFPVDPKQLDEMFAAVDRLLLNDSSISITRDQSPLLGSGLRCGFLGFLHMEVFNQRLQDEFDMNVIVTTPSVPYTIKYSDGTEKIISCVSDFPEMLSSKNSLNKFEIYEPMVCVTVITPQEYYGAMVSIIKEKRGSDIDVVYLEDASGNCIITSCVPWQEVVCDMSDMISNQSSGYASFNYEPIEHRLADLVKVEITINGDSCDPLSFISHSSKAIASGRNMAVKLKEVISRQQFEINIQARINKKSVASEKIQAYRKDVLIKSGKVVGGGDITRKKKLLEKQKEGKKRAKMIGKVEISQEAFYAVLKR